MLAKSWHSNQSDPGSREYDGQVASGTNALYAQSRRILGWGYSTVTLICTREHVRHAHSSEIE